MILKGIHVIKGIYEKSEAGEKIYVGTEPLNPGDYLIKASLERKDPDGTILYNINNRIDIYQVGFMNTNGLHFYRTIDVPELIDHYRMADCISDDVLFALYGRVTVSPYKYNDLVPMYLVKIAGRYVENPDLYDYVKCLNYSVADLLGINEPSKFKHIIMSKYITLNTDGTSKVHYYVNKKSPQYAYIKGVGFALYPTVDKKKNSKYTLRPRNEYPVFKEIQNISVEEISEKINKLLNPETNESKVNLDDIIKNITFKNKADSAVKAIIEGMNEANDILKKKLSTPSKKLIVINIEGIDAVGKESTSKALAKKLREMGLAVKKVSFPRYDLTFGKAIKEVLSGSCGDSSIMNPNLISPLYALDRIQYFKKNLDNLCKYTDVLICDRSFYSNFIYQGSKVPFDKLPDWIKENYNYEFVETGLNDFTTSMRTYVLTLDEASNKKQLSKRKSKDCNESNDSYLTTCRKFIKFMTDKRTVKAVFNNTTDTEWEPYLNAKCIPVNHADSADMIDKCINHTVDRIIDDIKPLISKETDNNERN